MAAFSATSAVASFSRFSPSRSVLKILGNRARRVTASTATESVGATTAPNARPAAIVIAGTSNHAANPTTTTVKATSPMLVSRIGSRRVRMSISDARMADANSSGGSRPYRMRSGSITSSPPRGRKEIPPPIATRASGADQPNRRASTVSPTVPTTRPTTAEVSTSGVIVMSTLRTIGRVNRASRIGDRERAD